MSRSLLWDSTFDPHHLKRILLQSYCAAGLTRLESFKCLLSTKRHCFALTIAFTSRHLRKDGKPFKTIILQSNLLKPPNFLFNTFCRKTSKKQVDLMMQIVRYWILIVSSQFWGWLKKQAQTCSTYKAYHYTLLKISQTFTCAYSVISVQTEFLLKIHKTWMAYSQFGIFMKTFW